MDTYRVIRHPGDEDEGARWACRARQQRVPVEIASGPAPAQSMKIGERSFLFISYDTDDNTYRLAMVDNGRN